MAGKPSKSALKRDQHARQALGERLVELSRERLERIPLDDGLREAIVTAASMRSRGALRRQKQLIGKLMRDIDIAPIEQALDAATRTERAAKATFRRAEYWRDRLMDDGVTGYEAFVAETGRANPGLRALLEELGRCRSRDQRRLLGRRLFRLIHADLSPDVQ